MSLLYDFAVDSRMRLFACALALTCLWPAVAGAQIDDPTIAVCNDCSADFQYGQAAMQATNLFPGETKDVYVVNISAMETMAFRISLITTVDPSGDLGIDISVVPIAGDPFIVDDLVAAMEIIKNMKDAMTQDVPADALDLPANIDSALDLVGPEGSAASLNRRTFENSLTEHFRSFWQQQMIVAVDSVARAVERFLAESGINFSGIVEVIFENGTRVSVKVESINQDISDPTELVIKFDTDEESVTAPGFLGIPLQPGELDDFDFTTPDPDLARELEQLIDRFGLDILGSGHSGENCTTTFTCSVDRCTLTVSC